jgi:chromosome segregation ATPase
MQSQVTTSSLERKLSVLQRGREEDERTMAEQKAQIDKLMSDRRLLDSQREDAVRRAESLEDEVATLKVSDISALGIFESL